MRINVARIGWPVGYLAYVMALCLRGDYISLVQIRQKFFKRIPEAFKTAVSRKSVIFVGHFVWGKIMAATRQGRGKRQLLEENDIYAT